MLQRRTKRKGKRPSKREIAHMSALKQLGKSENQIGLALGRSHNTVARYVRSPIFTDPKFEKMVAEYREKEQLDLTTLTIEARGRLHDLVGIMTPLEACAVADRSFQQLRLLQGKSTENIFSLRKIISQAHEAPEAIDVSKSGDAPLEPE